MVIEKRVLGKATFALVILLLLSMGAAVVSADLALKNINIIKSYGQGQNLEGSFEMKLKAEPADSQLKIVLSKSSGETTKEASILDLLRSSNVNFSCGTPNCDPLYKKGGASKNSDISSGESYVGLLIKTGNNTQINSLSFNLTGRGNAESCRVSQIYLDLLDDKTVDWQYTKPGRFCDHLSAGENYDSSLATTNYKIGDVPYCEKMSLPMATRFKIGVDMINSTVVAPLTMSINDLENGENAECNLVPGNGIRTCEVNFTVPSKKDYYICVQSSDEGDYKINAETEKPNCGKFGLEEFQCSDSLIDYPIYAQPASFAIFNETAPFNADVFSGFNPQDLTEYLQDYIEKKYASNCDGGCIIPIKISSAQDAALSSLSFRYTNNLGTVDSSDFYSLDRIESNMTVVNYTKFQLSKLNVTVPAAYGDYDLLITAGEETIVDTSISVDRVPEIKAVTPLTVFATVRSEFKAFVSSPDNSSSIVKYYWDFGDGTSSTTKNYFTNHSYPMGTFSLTLTATDNDGLSSSKTFTIFTQQPRDAANSTLIAKRADLIKTASAMDSLPVWYADIVRNAINIQKIAGDLTSMQDELRSSGADYASIKTALDELVIYSGINDEKTGTMTVVPKVNVEYLRKIGESIVPGKEEEIATSISAWQTANLQMSLDGATKVAVADTSKADNIDLLTLFELKLTSVDGTPKNNIYLIVKLPTGISYADARFNSNLTQDLNGAFGMVLWRVDSTTVTFALPGRVDPTELEIFASPTIAAIANPEVRCGNNICESSFGEDYKSCPEDCKKPITGAVVFSAIILIAALTGIFFIWKYYVAYYDMKLRNKLFSKETDFYNLSFFIANAINKGTTDEKIRSTLSKAEWNKGQIDYALRKVQENTRKTQRETALNFITDEIKNGKNEADIRKKLSSAGWDKKIIGWAMRRAGKISSE